VPKENKCFHSKPSISRKIRKDQKTGRNTRRITPNIEKTY
jgi:hypothetical protein